MAITEELIFDCIDTVKEVLPGNDVAVCGGAPRDLTLGKEPSDIDMYIYAENPKDYKAKIKDLSVYFGEGRVVGGGYMGAGGQGLPNIVGIREFKSEDGDILQVMGFKKEDDGLDSLAKSVMTTYDFGLCMIGYDSNKELVKSRYFELDVMSKCLTLRNWENLSLLKRSVDVHLPKLQAKYPDYKYNGPLGKQRVPAWFRKNFVIAPGILAEDII